MTKFIDKIDKMIDRIEPACSSCGWRDSDKSNANGCAINYKCRRCGLTTFGYAPDPIEVRRLLLDVKKELTGLKPDKNGELFK